MSDKQTLLICISLLAGFVIHALIISGMNPAKAELSMSGDGIFVNPVSGETFQKRTTYPSAEGAWIQIDQPVKSE